MRVHSIAAETTRSGTTRLTARVEGTEVFFSVEGAPEALRRSYDPFVLTGFMGAMEGDGRLSVAGDAPVSGELLSNLSEASWLYSEWWPDLAGLEVEAESVVSGGDAGNRHVGSFFSGGVDSLFTYIQNRERITHLVLCQGLDISLQENDRWEMTVRMVRDFAEAEEKELVLVKTNAKQFQSTTKSRNHGAILISTGIGLGFSELIVPASVTLKLMLPWGSHPMLDPLFSNGLTEVVHDSPIPRTEKIRGILDAGIGLDQLRVCNVYTEDVNCGVCEKCLRTRTTLTLLGAEGRHLKAIEDPRLLRKLHLGAFRFLGQWEENLNIAEELGRADFAREIHRLIRRSRTQTALLQLDADYLGGALLRVRRKLQGR